MIIAIDGPSGAGKSTIARGLAQTLGFAFMDTGAMYRAVTLACLRAGVDVGDGEACAERTRSIAFAAGPDRTLLIDGAAPGLELRSDAVTAAVSEVSAHAAVRESVVRAQRALAAGFGDVVVEGRDMTTVVFPDAELRVYLDASAAERARRRAEELGRMDELEQIEADIRRRDAYDSSREVAPLTRTAEQVHVETDGLAIEAIIARLVELVGRER